MAGIAIWIFSYRLVCSASSHYGWFFANMVFFAARYASHTATRTHLLRSRWIFTCLAHLVPRLGSVRSDLTLTAHHLPSRRTSFHVCIT